jgi:hypothetical protein
VGIDGIVGGAENNFFHHIAHASICSYEKGVKLDLYHYGMHNWLSREEFISKLQNFWGGFSTVARLQHAKVHLDQTPHNGLYIKDILEVVPSSCFIHLVRDPYMVARSMKKASKGWGQYWAPKTCRGAAHMWNTRNKAVLDAINEFGIESRVVRVSYEKLLSNTSGELKRLTDWLGHEVDGAAIDRAIANASRESMRSKFQKLNDSAASFVGSGQIAEGNVLQKAYVYYLTRHVRAELGY